MWGLPTRRFKRERYLAELRQVVEDGVALYLRSGFADPVFTASIWTDADARRSAISFDTWERSQAQVQNSIRFADEQIALAKQSGDTEMVDLFERFKAMDRACNPADFKYRDIAMTHHCGSMPHHWEERTAGACHAELQPVLLETMRWSVPILRTLPLHHDALVGVSGPKDWFQFEMPINTK